MISITKPKEIPNILKTKGKDETDKLCAKFAGGETKFDFDSSIYGHKEVKETLKTAQNHKCFLCESRITHISYGDVEHFRPKGGVCQTAEEKMSETGYYWLAYNWENLFLACQLCNQRFKKNLFPLENFHHRAKSHTDELNQEIPLFINPATENPEDFISFRGVIPFAIDGNQKGEITIEHAGLRREELKENRRELYEKMKSLYQIAHEHPDFPPEIKQKAMNELSKQLVDCQLSTHQYSAMFRSAVRDNFKF